MNKSFQPIVSILCDTFSQELFIRDTLNSFLSQKTTFCFEIIIHDDASNDNTAEIIKEFENNYPLIIKPIYQKTNKF